VRRERIAFVVHKKKAGRLARHVRAGARHVGALVRETDGTDVGPGEIAVFYGVTRATLPLFLRKLRVGAAIYMDNAWLDHQRNTYFRACWNGVQPDPALLTGARNAPVRVVPHRAYTPRKRTAVLCQQSEVFFEGLGIPGGLADWTDHVSGVLRSAGWSVSLRAKPTSRLRRNNRVAATNLGDVASAEIVVSMCSTVSLRAACMGIPAYCTEVCALTPVCPPYLPTPGRATPPDPGAVRDLVRLLATAQWSCREMEEGRFLKEMLDVPDDRRRGLLPRGTGLDLAPAGQGGRGLRRRVAPEGGGAPAGPHDEPEGQARGRGEADLPVPQAAGGVGRV